MITLYYPTNNQDCQWVIIRGFAFGPLNLDKKPVLTKVSYRNPTDFLDQGRYLYGENFVSNLQSSANITYNPAMDKVTRNPTTSNPDQIVLGSTNFKYSQLYFGGTAKYGLGYHDAIGRFVSSTSVESFIVEKLDDLHYLIWDIYASKSTPKKISTMSCIEVIIDGTVANNKNLCAYRYRSQAYDHLLMGGDTSVQTDIDWTTGNLSTSEAHIAASMSRALSWGTWTTSSTEWWTLKSPFSLTLDAVELAMYGAFNSILDQMFPYPIEDKNYGDLAQDAAEKVDRNNVNMIAFLRDLRHPTEMIPKLKKLKSLKGLAGNYLSVEYGILPTISDLENIVAAIKKRKPYLDKNGFSTYSAGYTKSISDGDFTHTLEQHLKLAIENEDNELQMLTEAVDSWGFLPTFTNVWDLVPYSFVLDWFVDVGGLLERVDTRLKLLQYNIRYVTMSRKTVSTKRLRGSVISPYIGTVQVVDYHRWVSDQCPLPPLSLNLTFRDFNHWLESGALLLQRAK